MQNQTPSPATGGNPIPDFTPVPRRCNRHDGWTPARQRALIDALADTGSVTAACRRINMSTFGAYYLRRQPGAEEFRAAWSAALDFGIQTLTDLAIDRVKHGTPVPIFWKGQQVGERRRYNDRLHMFILKHHQPHIYNPPQLKTGTKHLDTLKREWRSEWEQERRAEHGKSIASITQKIDNIRGGLLREIVKVPEARAAWEILVGPTDWTKVGGWQDDQPTQFAADNMTVPSTIVTIALNDRLAEMQEQEKRDRDGAEAETRHEP